MGLWRRKRDDEDFHVEDRAREIVAYWEGDRAFLFDAAWGARPRELYVPSEAIWDQVVPGWMKGRRAVVVGRLAKRSGHRIVETDGGYEPGNGELRPVASEAEAQAIGSAFLDGNRGIVGPWTMESTSETEGGWRFAFRSLDPERYTPAIPDGRQTLFIRRDTGEIEFPRTED